MRTRVACALALLAALAAPLAGCEAEAFTRTVTGRTVTADGQWTIDDILYRTYDVSHVQAYDAARAFFARKGWDLWESESGQAYARVEGAMPDGRYVKIIAFENKTREQTDIGIRVGKGDFVDSSRLLDEFEQTLDGARLDRPPGEGSPS